MPSYSSNPTQEIRRKIIAMLETVSGFGFFALVVFIPALGYLLWGLFAGNLLSMSEVQNPESVRSMVEFACKAMMYSGVLLLIVSALRWHVEEAYGYAALIVGAALYWGMPSLMIPMAQSIDQLSLAILLLIIGTFKAIGEVAIILAVPFIALDFYYRLAGMKRDPLKGVVVADKKIDGTSTPAVIRINCWQMGFCREHLKKHCDAFKHGKSCWKIKRGCYCDEDLLLRTMQGANTNKVTGLDQRYSQLAGKNLTPAQMRARCRQCFLYTEHQKLKYKVLSPLTFPVVIAVLAIYYKPLKSLLDIGLSSLDKFASMASVASQQGHVPADQFANHLSASSVDWLFMVCIGLIVETYLLRLIEYLVFDLQV